MEQNEKKIYDVRTTEKSHMVIIGTSPGSVGQAIVFAIDGSTEVQRGKPIFVVATKDEVITGFDDRGFAEQLAQAVIAYHAPNYPDEARVPHLRGGFTTEIVHPLEWKKLKQWLDDNNIELTGAVPEIDNERMSREYDFGRAFTIEFVSTDNGTFIRVEGSSLETLGMKVELNYRVEEDAVFFTSIYQNQEKSFGPELLPLSWYLMGKVVKHVDQGPKLVVVDEGLISGHMSPGEFTRLLGISPYERATGLPEEGDYIIDSGLVILAQNALAKLGYKLKPKAA